MCPPMKAHWRHLANTTELVHLSAHQSLQTKRQTDPFSSAVLHSSRQKVPILYNGRPYPPELPSHGGILTPYNTWSLGLTWVLNPNGNSIASAVFAGLTSMTDRQTIYSVGNNSLIGCMYVRSNNAWLMWDTAKPHTRFMLIETISPQLHPHLNV